MQRLSAWWCLAHVKHARASCLDNEVTDYYHCCCYVVVIIIIIQPPGWHKPVCQHQHLPVGSLLLLDNIFQSRAASFQYPHTQKDEARVLRLLVPQAYSQGLNVSAKTPPVFSPRERAASSEQNCLQSQDSEIKAKVRPKGTLMWSRRSSQVSHGLLYLSGPERGPVHHPRIQGFVRMWAHCFPFLSWPQSPLSLPEGGRVTPCVLTGVGHANGQNCPDNPKTAGGVRPSEEAPAGPSLT